MQISYVFNKQDTWEICIRCFLDSDDVAIYPWDAKFIVIQGKGGILSLTLFCKYFEKSITSLAICFF